MDKQNIVVTFNTSPEEKMLFLEMLGSEASLTFLNEISPLQREQALEDANILLSWNFPREIQPQEYPHLQQVRFIQLLSAGAALMVSPETPFFFFRRCRRRVMSRYQQTPLDNLFSFMLISQ